MIYLPSVEQPDSNGFVPQAEPDATGSGRTYESERPNAEYPETPEKTNKIPKTKPETESVKPNIPEPEPELGNETPFPERDPKKEEKKVPGSQPQSPEIPNEEDMQNPEELLDNSVGVYRNVRPAPSTVSKNQGVLRVRIPDQAELLVNGVRMKTQGSVRSFQSEEMQKGVDYVYEVTARIERDGEWIERTEHVQLNAGKMVDLTFEITKPSAISNSRGTSKIRKVSDTQRPTQTKLRLEVPEDTIIQLAGEETGSSGKVRDFDTDLLKTGETWKNYEIKMFLERGGKVYEKTQVINLVGGRQHRLKFSINDFASDDLVQTNHAEQ